jgi:hypothetical protein
MRAPISCSIAAVLGLTCASLASDASPTSPVDDQYHAVTAMRDMNSLGIAIEAYARDHGAYPVVASVENLRALLEPRYAARLETRDAWGTAFRYSADAKGASYLLVSAGSDRAFDESSWNDPVVSTDSKTDAVFSRHFVRKWSIVFP